MANGSLMLSSRALGGALRPAVGDARAILRHRLLPAVLLALATLCFAMYAVAATRTLDAVVRVEWPGFLALAFLFYADAMRMILVPAYRVTVANVLKWVAVYVIRVASVIVCVLLVQVMIAPFRLSPHIDARLQLFATYVATIFIDTRLCFAAFALKDYGAFRACLRSWALTGRRTFLSTLALTSSFDIGWFLINAGTNALRHTIGPSQWIILKVVVSFAFLSLIGSFFYPALARWMLVCERLYPSGRQFIA